MLFFSVKLFGDTSSSGPNQIVLTLGAAIAAIIGIRLGYRWTELQRAMIDGISTAMGAILILLTVGALIGTWLMSGTVPSLIYFGLELLSPQWFFAASCLRLVSCPANFINTFAAKPVTINIPRFIAECSIAIYTCCRHVPLDQLCQDHRVHGQRDV